MTDFIVCNRLLVSSASLELTQICSFLWPGNIPLYICTTTSLSIYLYMDIWVASVLSVVTSASVSIGVHEMNIFLFFLISYCKDNILCIFAPFFFLPHLIVSPGNTIFFMEFFFSSYIYYSIMWIYYSWINFCPVLGHQNSFLQLQLIF